MREIDAAADVPVDVLVERAGRAVATVAQRILGGAYGRTVDVIAGPGNNGADGRVAARVLAAAGMRVRLHDALRPPAALTASDLVIDAAFGTGMRGTWQPPAVEAPVLAVDIPSGIDGLTGIAAGEVLVAARTLTFGALKPGLLLGDGPQLSGEVEVADIGLGAAAARRTRLHHLGASDADTIALRWPRRAFDAHKWRAALRVIAGSDTMPGAASLCADAAMRAGAGIVHLSTPGTAHEAQLPREVVSRPVPAVGWATEVLASLDRFHALVLGPGLGRLDATADAARRVAVEAPLPLVVDGDGLFALAWNARGAAGLLRDRRSPTVLTPHDGEYRMLTGEDPRADRVVAARRLAFDTRSVVLLKGPSTVVAGPDGDAVIVTTGDARLATAGSGDVLTGVIGALLAQGVEPFDAAVLGAWVHGMAGRRAMAVGAVASDLPVLVAAVASDLVTTGGLDVSNGGHR